jgi:hypothetical protein
MMSCLSSLWLFLPCSLPGDDALILARIRLLLLLVTHGVAFVCTASVLCGGGGERLDAKEGLAVLVCRGCLWPT